MLQFALLEYKYAALAAPANAGADMGEAAGAADASLGAGAGTGSQERARTMLETLLAANPKRLDVWSVFIDAEMAAMRRRTSTGQGTGGAAANAAGHAAALAADIASTRSLFDRILGLRLSSKKVKFLLKRYVAFEREFGSAATIRRVAALAREYVANAMQAAADGSPIADSAANGSELS